MGKIEVNKKQKKESLLNTAFSLFTSKGFQKDFDFRYCRQCRGRKGNLLPVFFRQIRSP